MHKNIFFVIFKKNLKYPMGCNQLPQGLHTSILHQVSVEQKNTPQITFAATLQETFSAVGVKGSPCVHFVSIGTEKNSTSSSTLLPSQRGRSLFSHLDYSAIGSNSHT